jgi:small-conductance mechanosensitive channel
MDKVFDWSEPIVAASARMLQNFLEFLPSFAGGIAILVVGWLVARLARGLTIKLFGGVDRFSGYVGIDRVFPTGHLSDAAAQIIASIVFWIIILVFLTSATSLLGLTMFSGWLDRMVAHLPNILSGALIIFAGVVFGNLANDAVQTAVRTVSQRQRVLLGRSAQAFTLATMVVIGMDQIGIDITLLITVIAVVIGAALGGLSIAFSLGSRTLVSNLIGARYLSNDHRVGETIRVGDMEGTIIEISTVAVVLDTKDGRLVVPAKIFGEQPSLLLEKEVQND